MNPKLETSTPKPCTYTRADDDGFQSPGLGNACVSALGISLDISAFSLSLLRSMTSLLSAHAPIGDALDGAGPALEGEGDLGAPQSLRVLREEQETLLQRFQSLAALPVLSLSSLLFSTRPLLLNLQGLGFRV